MNSEISSTKRTIFNIIRYEIARRVFWDFCLHYDRAFFTARPFLKEIADALQLIEERQIKSLSVSMPPRAGKSYIMTLFSAWMLGRHPLESIMRNTCTATLYDKFSYDARNVVKSLKFQQVFSHVRLAPDKQNLAGWNLQDMSDPNDIKESKQVAYFGAGVGGTIIGFGASLAAITDDLYKDMNAALSEVVIDSTRQWKQSAHDSRLEKDCPKIDIGTRWSKKDIIGENIDAKKYDVSIVIPALDKITDKSFCENVKSTAEYVQIRQELISANSFEIWLAEYQQEPAEVQGLLFKPGDIERFTWAQFKKDTTTQVVEDGKKKNKSTVETILGYIDPAEGGEDALAFTVGQVTIGKVYVTHVIYTQDTVDVTPQRCADLINDLLIRYVRIEKNGIGSGFIRDVKRLTDTYRILSQKNSTHKGTRIWNEYGFIQKHFCFLAETEYTPGSDYDKYMRNLFSYMKIGDNQHDDAPDSCAGLSRFIQVVPATKKLFLTSQTTDEESQNNGTDENEDDD